MRKDKTMNAQKELNTGVDVKVKDIIIEECKAQLACLLNEVWHSRLPRIHWSNVVRNTSLCLLHI